MMRLSKRSRTRGSISILVFLFFMSALIRISLNASEVLAKSEEGKPSDDTSIGNSEGQKQNNQLSLELLRALQNREERIAVREREQASRQKALEVATKEIERRLVAMEDAELRLSATLAKANTAAEHDVGKLIEVYESMKPKDAAALFETMEPTFAAGFLGRMRPDIAAGILAGLSPKVAYTISVILAGRNANAPKS